MKTDVFLKIGSVSFQCINTDEFEGFNWELFKTGESVFVDGARFFFVDFKQHGDNNGIYYSRVILSV